MGLIPDVLMSEGQIRNMIRDYNESKKFIPRTNEEKEALADKTESTLDTFYKTKREVEKELMEEESDESTPLDFVPESDPPTPHHRREGYSPLLHGRTSPKQKEYLLDAETGEILEFTKKKKEKGHWLRI